MTVQVPTPESRFRATYADVLAAPGHAIAGIIGGALHMHPRPASKHALVASSLIDELVSPVQKFRGGPGGWWIVIEPEVHLAGWRRERVPEYPDAPYFTLAPADLRNSLDPAHRSLQEAPDLRAGRYLASVLCPTPRCRGWKRSRYGMASGC